MLARVVAFLALLFCIESPLAQTLEPSSAVQQKLATLASQTLEVKAYAAFLDSLDLTNPESNLKAAFAMFERFDSSSAAVKDDAFRLFFKFYFGVLSATTNWNEGTYWNEHDVPGAERLCLCGIGFGYCTMGVLGAIDTEFISKCLEFLDPESHLKRWLECCCDLGFGGWIDDADTGLSPADRLRYLLSFETTGKACSDLPEVQAGLADLMWPLVFMYLGGLPNYPLFDQNNGKLDQDAKTSWEWCIKTHPESVIYPMVKAAYDSLATTDFVRNAGYDQVAGKAWDYEYVKGLVDEMLKKAKVENPK